jgi:hypothetical protein
MMPSPVSMLRERPDPMRSRIRPMREGTGRMRERVSVMGSS